MKELLKSGKNTTEFWLALAALVLGALAASGILPAEHWSTQVVGLLITVLASLGYKWSRTSLKLEAMKYEAYGSMALEQDDDDDDDDDDGEEEPSPNPTVPDALPLSLED